jgi:predicted MPP superfamily phosphohydrolase
MRNYHFPFVVLAVILFISWLNYRLLVRWTPQFRRPGAAYVFWGLTALAVLTIAISWSVRFSPWLTLPDWHRYLAYCAFAWLTAQVFMLPLHPLLYLGHRLAAPSPTPDAESPAGDPLLTRRAFLRDSLIAVPAAALGLSTAGVYAAEAVLAERRLTLTLPGLPAAFDGLTILQLSDTHIGPYFSLAMLDRVLDRIRRLAPDILAVTGDFIDDLSQLTPAVEKLAALAPVIPQGIYYCWGNHEYFRNLGAIAAAVKKAPITLLNNSHQTLRAGGSALHLIGVDFPWANSQQARREKCRRFLEETLAELPPAACKILLAHHPDFLNEGFAAGIPLTLAGHTHGGQVGLFGRPLLPLQYDYMRGLYEKDGCYGYVNTGAGHWFPFRLGCPPEIALFTLKAKA